MSDEPAPARKRQDRPARAEADMAQRRRRTTSDSGPDLALSVEGAVLDRDNYAYRWALGTPKRVQRLYGQDWDVVEGAAANTDTKRFAMRDGAETIDHVLMSKPIDLYKADHAANEAKRKQMEVITTAGTPLREGGEGLSEAVAYRPNDVNSITRGPL
jgi:hypothetical protein